LWLEPYQTNHDPKLISGYFTDTVKKIGGFPAIVRADIGTENCYVQVLLRIMRGGYDDVFAGKSSFIFGKSIANKRIEAW